MDLDQSGRGFQRVRTWLGPSLGWTDELVQPSTYITTGGTYNVQPGDNLLLVNVAAPVTIQLPDVRVWVQQNAYQPATAFERALTIKDFGGGAASFNITIAPFGTQAIDNIQASVVISTTRAAIKLIPLIDLSGWTVALASSSGGGGGGDVFKGGNNTFTGINTFSNTITAPTVAAADSSTNVATTAWVTAKNYVTNITLSSYALLASPTFTGTPTAPTQAPGDNSTNLATTAFVQNATSGFQPLDGDLTSLAAASATNSMYYRSAANVWSPVVIGGGISFSGGVLGSSAGGGNVSSVGTPTNGQLAQWTSSTQVQGIAASSLGFAPLASPAFTGVPTTPTPATADNSTTVASTAFVKNAIGAGGNLSTVNVQTFTTSGTYTPTAGMKYCVIECVAGGGGGGGVGNTTTGAFVGIMGGGGSGGYSRKTVSAATVGASQTVTIGVAGAAGAAGTGGNGGNGGNTSVGSLCIAIGGSGGGGWNNGSGLLPGGPGGITTGAVGDVVAAGSPGANGSSAPAANVSTLAGGNGGSSFFGGGAVPPTVTAAASSAAGAAASNYGSGGSGAMSFNVATARLGGAGSAGYVIITEYI
jgi:hypothetical protein